MNIEVHATIFAANEADLRTAFHEVIGASWMLNAAKKSLHLLSHAYTRENNDLIAAVLRRLATAVQHHVRPCPANDQCDAYSIWRRRDP